MRDTAPGLTYPVRPMKKSCPPGLCAVPLLAALAAACGSSVPELSSVAVVEGLASPESAYYDDASKSWFVSNLGVRGVPNDGFISQVDADGVMIKRELVVGLDDPKGVTVFEGVLYVSDRTALVRVALDAPDIVERIEAPGALFLNDVAVEHRTGDVFVSDMMGDAIYRYRDGVIAELLRTPKLQGPNGLTIQRHALIIATIGPDVDPATMQTSKPGRLMSLDLASLELTDLSGAIGFLDGLEPLGAGFIVSDYQVGVYYVDGAADPALILDADASGLGSSADIGHSRDLGRIAVPEASGTRLFLYDY